MLKLESLLFEEKSEALASYAPALCKAQQALFDGSLAMTGWTKLPETEEETIASIEREAARLRSLGDTMVVIGIGGSYAGALACDRMLRTKQTPMRLEYAGWNLDASYHRALLERLDGEEPVLCVISKSGSTRETALAFGLLRDYMERRYGEKAAERIAVIAGAHKSPLHDLAVQKGYAFFEMPDDVGGRYSVLSAVGLLPLAAAGYDVRALLSGAGEMKRAILSAPFDRTDCGRYAAARNLLYREGKRLEIFSLTEERQAPLGQWLAQLFGESEGKNGLGLFPTAVHYSTDLHSLGQFLEDGSRIFFETMLLVENAGDDLSVPGFADTYRESQRAVCEAVWRVRNAKHTPILRFVMEDLSEKSIGALLFFFETACAASGLLLGVDPFDQPGVEAYKNEVRRILG